MAITLERYAIGQLEVLTAKSLAELIGLRFGTALASFQSSRTGRAFLSQLQTLLATKG